MSPVAWLWGIAERHRWSEDCPAGVPVPADDRCDALECESVRLTALAEGQRGRVTCLEEPGGPAAARLAAMGVLPGAEVELVQRFPAFVFRIGHGEFAVDEGLAGRIRLLPEPTARPAARSRRA